MPLKVNIDISAFWTSCLGAGCGLGSMTRETPQRVPVLNPTAGSLKRDLIERVYIRKGRPNPNSHGSDRNATQALWPQQEHLQVHRDFDLSPGKSVEGWWKQVNPSTGCIFWFHERGRVTTQVKPLTFLSVPRLESEVMMS